MGSSLAMALKKRGIAGKVTGFARRPETRKKALAGKIVDAVCDRLEDAVRDADLVVACAPVSVIPEIITAAAGHLPPRAVVTDVGSVKARIAAAAEKALADNRAEFLGSHPIAGSEQRGLEAARDDLYRGAVVAITPTRRTSRRALRIVSGFWRALGAEVVPVSPAVHDRVLARTSHLPHLIAALLAGCAGRERAVEYGKFCGAGFRDTTRIAEGDPELWRDILANNACFLRGELKVFAGKLANLSAILSKGDERQIAKYLRNGRECRRKLLAKH